MVPVSLRSILNERSGSTPCATSVFLSFNRIGFTRRRLVAPCLASTLFQKAEPTLGHTPLQIAGLPSHGRQPWTFPHRTRKLQGSATGAFEYGQPPSGLVNRAGLEPATLCLEGRCSIRLSYRFPALRLHRAARPVEALAKRSAVPARETGQRCRATLRPNAAPLHRYPRQRLSHTASSQSLR